MAGKIWEEGSQREEGKMDYPGGPQQGILKGCGEATVLKAAQG